MRQGGRCEWCTIRMTPVCSPVSRNNETPARCSVSTADGILAKDRSYLHPISVLQLLRQVGVGEVLEPEGREGLDLRLFLGLDHQLQLAAPRLVLLDEVLLCGVSSPRERKERRQRLEELYNR